jgi:diguanylate cyclase (GGDEF)-like protein
MNDITQNLAILLVVLVAVNTVVVGVALWRARRTRTAAVRRAAPLPSKHEHEDDPLPSAGPRPTVRVMTSFEAGQVPLRTDPLTGLLLPGEWNRILVDEDARIHRYGRPATVVMVELDGLDRLIGVFGHDAADRVLLALSDAMRRHARSADHVARLGPGRFGILLPETGEVEAVNYVERAREVCELWLESGAMSLRLAIGWASLAPDANLADAVAVAQDRMFAELRRGAIRDAPEAPHAAPPPPSGLEGTPAPA